MEEKYHVKLSVLLESLEYCSDVDSDGYYVVRKTSEIIKYGEDLSDEYSGEDDVWDYLKANESMHLPTLNDLEKASPNWTRDVTYRYIDEKIADTKQKKLLTKAYTSIFGNRILPAFPGSTKFRTELTKLGRKEEWEQFVKDAYAARQLDFITTWCKENSVEIIHDT